MTEDFRFSIYVPPISQNVMCPEFGQLRYFPFWRNTIQKDIKKLKGAEMVREGSSLAEIIRDLPTDADSASQISDPSQDLIPAKGTEATVEIKPEPDIPQLRLESISIPLERRETSKRLACEMKREIQFTYCKHRVCEYCTYFSNDCESGANVLTSKCTASKFCDGGTGCRSSLVGRIRARILNKNKYAPEAMILLDLTVIAGRCAPLLLIEKLFQNKLDKEYSHSKFVGAFAILQQQMITVHDEGYKGKTGMLWYLFKSDDIRISLYEKIDPSQKKKYIYNVLKY